jgi:hypothetical protein
MTKKNLLVPALLFVGLQFCAAQSDKTPKEEAFPKDSLSKFDRFNAKARKFFKFFPVPIVSYSKEEGSVVGLAKFNVFRPSKKDTISKPSKISLLGTISTKGNANVFIANDLILKENKYMILSSFNYRKTPEYLLGIGNDVKLEDAELVSSDRIKLFALGLVRVKKSFYAGLSLDLANYFKIQTDSNSFLVRDSVAGLNGGSDVGIGIAGGFDNRDNRYNTSKGAFVVINFMTYPKFLGGTYQFTKMTFDARKFYMPWKKRKDVLALEAIGTFMKGDVPFYDLALLGGENMMRGYYLGALRDKVYMAAQAEYRKNIWNIFGVVGWVAMGRVAAQFKDLSLNAKGLWLSYGGGLRIQVDADNDVNLRIDAGFGPNGVNGVYINFSEAF